jgi:alpha-tubulin suppressor-like RCC1 family protein
VCWGSNQDGELGAETIEPESGYPVPVEGLSIPAVDVAASDSGTCAVLSDGTVSCWGDGRTEPEAVPGVTRAVAISTRGGGYSGRNRFSCVVLDDGTGQCWGTNESGQLGDGTTEASDVPVQVRGLSGAVAIEAPCAILDDGSVVCWGPVEGLGIGPVPTVAYPDVADVVEIAPDVYITCVRLSDGRVQCWGGNDLPFPDQGAVPTTLPEVTDAAAIDLGDHHGCALLSDGTARCWGSNDEGQLGDGTYAPRWVPVEVSGLEGAVGIAAGDMHSCALRSEGTVACWGRNEEGQLGRGSSEGSASPVEVTGLSDAVAISVGSLASCALRSGGTVVCWGAFFPDEYPLSGVPSTVTGIADARAISVGEGHACALLGDGTARCWGDDNEGQLGDGPGESDEVFPVTVSTVSGLSDLVHLTAGSLHACALDADGAAFCWGRNREGQLGDGRTESSSVPVRVATLPPAQTITAGGYHTCALLVDGRMACWGSNHYGELGVMGNIDWQGVTPVGAW